MSLPIHSSLPVSPEWLGKQISAPLSSFAAVIAAVFDKILQKMVAHNTDSSLLVFARAAITYAQMGAR